EGGKPPKGERPEGQNGAQGNPPEGAPEGQPPQGNPPEGAPEGQPPQGNPPEGAPQGNPPEKPAETDVQVVGQ
ncbi:MAG: hypothetical protein J5947_07395, partial [Clostridium sp.]|nr:hypothetical protein [Clostridium sp.]